MGDHQKVGRKLRQRESHAAAENLLRTGHADAYAGPRPLALTIAARLPGSRVVEDHFLVIFLAAMVPKGHAGRLAYVSEFIEEAKVSGVVKQIIERNGLRGVQVRLSKKSPCRFLGEMQKKMTSQNAPQSAIS